MRDNGFRSPRRQSALYVPASGGTSPPADGSEYVITDANLDVITNSSAWVYDDNVAPTTEIFLIANNGNSIQDLSGEDVTVAAGTDTNSYLLTASGNQITDISGDLITF